MEHYNIQINVQKVETAEASTPVARRRGSSYSEEEETPRGSKRVTEVLAVKVVADDETEAYSKARKMLDAATPDYLRTATGSDIRPAGAI